MGQRYSVSGAVTFNVFKPTRRNWRVGYSYGYLRSTDYPLQYAV